MNAKIISMWNFNQSGISPKYIKMSDFQTKIPMLGEIESLNVSVACGIILYEAVKQRL